MLEEDLEMTAYAFLRAMWPLPRHYIFYFLKLHTHEDIPFRWFQLLMDSEEPAATTTPPRAAPFRSASSL